MTPELPATRMTHWAVEWDVVIDRTFETESSLIGIGDRRGDGVVLKIVKERGDEWESGKVLRAFNGSGVVRVHEAADGALLLERLNPGTSLLSLVLEDRDDSATAIVADVIRRMNLPAAPHDCPTVMRWGDAFERYRQRGDDHRIPHDLVEDARRRFTRLASTSRRQGLLHGDLHHHNIVFDAKRGWLAIDPKGVAGEVEYEIGALLRNPIERPDLFVSPDTIRRRTDQLVAALGIDRVRTIEWAFAQAVLSAIWSVEDGFDVSPESPVIRLAHALRLILPEPDNSTLAARN
jgi:streptomycin 6-kinase